MDILQREQVLEAAHDLQWRLRAPCQQQASHLPGAGRCAEQPLLHCFAGAAQAEQVLGRQVGQQRLLQSKPARQEAVLPRERADAHACYCRGLGTGLQRGCKSEDSADLHLLLCWGRLDGASCTCLCA